MCNYTNLLVPQFITEELKTPVPEKDGGRPVRTVSVDYFYILFRNNNLLFQSRGFVFPQSWQLKIFIIYKAYVLMGNAPGD